jgi:uncharacterized phage-associated protein
MEITKMSVRTIDVADYILQKRGTLSAIKLQKLVYYTQAWHLVWEDIEIFEEEIQAWANGPIVPCLYAIHRGSFRLPPGFFKGDLDCLQSRSQDVIDRVLEFYGNKDAQWLSDLSHMEEPWKIARIGLGDDERGSSVISIESMAEYYSSL